MNRTDTYYRALLEYRKLVDEQRDCKLENKSVAKSGTKADRIYFERKSCIIDRSWVDAIEKGLVFIEKAIKEDRQFIRSNGEVVPIEKVKNVSKSSVEHLARHSNLITRVHEGEDIIPDQLYTVEKLNDYAVYENRFLYMLLCYLRDFISTRYNKILDISNTYHGTMSMNKSATTDKQTINYRVELEHTRRDDEYLISTNKEKDVIDRIDLLLKTVLAFLATPLMEIVAKAPMLKPPVTKTNVLKMNNNFKGAMELYGFVTSYEGEGFTVTVEKTELSPFDEDLALEIANTVTLSAFITYENALGIKKELLRSYNQEEQRLREEEFENGQKRLEDLRRQLKNSGITPEDYIVSLEDRVRLLEKRANELPRVQARLDTAQERLAAARVQLDEAVAKEKEARGALDTVQYRLDTQIKKYDDDMTRVRAEHAEAVAELHLRHEAELDRVKNECDERISENDARHAQELDRTRAECDERIESIRLELQDRVTSAEAELSDARAQLDTQRREHTAELKTLSDDYERKLEMLRELVGMEKEKAEAFAEAARISDAKLYALRFEIGDDFGADGFVFEDNFDNLERTYRAFRKFYQEQWAKAKKHIRHDLLRAKKKDESDAEQTDGEAAEAAEEVQEVTEVSNTYEAADNESADTEASVTEDIDTDSMGESTVSADDATDITGEATDTATADEDSDTADEADDTIDEPTDTDTADESTDGDTADEATDGDTEQNGTEVQNPAGLTDEQIEEIRENAKRMATSGEIYVGENTPSGSFALDSISEASYVGASENNEKNGTAKGRRKKK